MKLVKFPPNLYGDGVGSISSTVETAAGSASNPALASTSFPSLFSIACQAVECSLSGADMVCTALSVAELLLPTTRRIYSHCLASLARNLLEAFQFDPIGFNYLSPAVMVELLQQNDIPVGL